MTVVISEYVNSENEKISIKSCDSGPFAGQLILVIHDDARAGGTQAPMLLDNGTMCWLTNMLRELV